MKPSVEVITHQDIVSGGRLTERVVNDADFSVLMTGEERYPTIGFDLYAITVDLILAEFAGLPLYAGCYEKAMIAAKYFSGTVVFGAMRVLSDDYMSAYGFDYNPPTELHAWIRLHNMIIDFSLPGVILRGMKLSDEQGPFLKGREPAILMGPPPDWLLYFPVGVGPRRR